MEIKCLKTGEFFNTETPKDSIYLHHSDGAYRPDWTISSWDRQDNVKGTKVRSAKSYVIGSLSSKGTSDQYDGLLYESFDPIYWSHHLGIKSKNNTFINQKSIAIELCNYGSLSKSKEGRFYTKSKVEIDESFVTKLDISFRGSIYYQAYTEKQIESLRLLILNLSDRFDIDVSKGIKKELIESSDVNIAFGINNKALSGYPGIWSHSNVRIDRNDVYPCPRIIEMLKGL